MSLMEALVGHTPGLELVLAMAGLDPRKCGRLRDCYLNSDLQAVIFTRNGGGNRPDYQEATAYFQSQPGYVRDYDDEFDTTYAYYILELDKTEYPRELLQEFFNKTTAAVGTPMERFHRVLAKMQDKSTPKDDPELVRAMQVGQKILAPIKQAMDQSGLTVVSVNPDGSVDVKNDSNQ